MNKSNQKSRLIMGRNCLKEVLQHRCQNILRVMIANGLEAGVDLQQIEQLVKDKKKKIERIDRAALSRLLDSDSHQGVAAEVIDHTFDNFKEALLKIKDKERSLILALDSLQDPQNIGSLLRAAECFGVDLVIWSKNRGPTITPVVSKVSCGASELVDILIVSNLADALRKLKEERYWVIVADNTLEAENLFDFKPAQHQVLVMGSEGDGVRKLTRDLADFVLKIPMYGKIDSLNVSQAGALMLGILKNSLKLA